MDAAAIERELAKLPPDPQASAIELDREEYAAAGLLLALSTQWQRVGMAAVATGLDYKAIEPTARLLGIELTPAVFLNLRTMEAEVLQAWAERQPDAGGRGSRARRA